MKYGVLVNVYLVLPVIKKMSKHGQKLDILIKTNYKNKYRFNHSLFLSFDGILYVCGRNDYGQLGLESEDKFKNPVEEEMNYVIRFF